MSKLTFWYEFASTYSYPAAMRIEQHAQAVGIDVVWRPFLLGPIFKKQGWSTSPFNIYPNKGAHMWRDLDRVCADLTLPFQRPKPFPQNGLLAARIATYGMSLGWGAAFSKAVYKAEFGEGKNISDTAVLSGLIASVGGDKDAVLQKAVCEENKQHLKDANENAIALGVFGSPSFTTEDGELFWGNDRLEQACAWAATKT